MVHLHATLRGSIKRSLRLKKIKNDPLDGVKAPSRMKSNVNPLTQSEMREVLRIAENEEGTLRLHQQIQRQTGRSLVL
jgi:site-specific recombinase XerC